MILRQGSCPKHEKPVCLKSFSCGGTEREVELTEDSTITHTKQRGTNNSSPPSTFSSEQIVVPVRSYSVRSATLWCSPVTPMDLIIKLRILTANRMHDQNQKKKMPIRNQRNLIPLGISPNRSRNSAGQFSGSRPFWLKNAEAQRSRPTPLKPTRVGRLTAPLP